MHTPRIISLIASATEIVCALGAEEHLVGRSHECDFPPSVLALPVCSAAKFDVNCSSLEIDQRVKAVLSCDASVYVVHRHTLEELRPTHILTQQQCEVCAVSLKDVQQATCTLPQPLPQVLALSPNALADVWQDIAAVGTALGRPQHAAALLAQAHARLNQLRTATAELPKPRLACIEWIEPLMAAGNWVPELVEIAGGINLLGTAGCHSPWMTFDDLIAADPDVIAVMPCGFDLDRTHAEMHWLTAHPAWHTLRAVQRGRVYLTDGNQYFNRPGPRLVDSAEILVDLLHGPINRPHGKGWIRLVPQ